MSNKIKKILIANRSEIAVRIIKACKKLGIVSVAVYSDADKNSLHKRDADESIYIGESVPSQSYLNFDKIIEAAKSCKADSIHPGYGFLSENNLFAERCQSEGIIFIGPSPESILLLGNKVQSRIKMEEAGVPLIPGMTGSSDDIEEFIKAADKAGYPVILKAAAGGGGKGMRVVTEQSQLQDAIEAAKREALSAFGDDTLFLEKYIENPRHIEFQIIADSHRNCVHLFERECSIQRRHQKIIEETPSVALSDSLRKKMGNVAVKVAQTANYVNAGTVEFLLDDKGNYYFLEMNTRIQVEHPITEMVTSVDLVAEQIKIASGEKLSEAVLNASQKGHAIECRIYAEDGENRFMPSVGDIIYYSEPSGEGVRVDSGIDNSSTVTIDYDPIMAKLIVHADNRELAINKMLTALDDYKILGIRTSKKFMKEVLSHENFKNGKTFTNFIETNMTDRQDSIPVELAVALATAFEFQRGSNSLSDEEKDRRPSAWETIGGWEIGGDIK